MADLLYRNRRLLVLALLLIFASGAGAFTQLPRQEDPTLTPRFGLVLTYLRGASAERMEALVTEKLERELREMEEIKVLSSTSRGSVSAIQIELGDDVMDVDTVWSRVRDRFGDVHPTLPPGTTMPELQDREQTDAFTLIASLRWAADTEPNLAVLRRLGEELRELARDVPGTAFVDLIGAPEEEVRIELDR
ncbi:MAG: efflux RND transporter permease subunit, partial [Planctomycetota bacterium]|nr:efflux RND transporter permease subunit [Planctomycetota bacterium]